MYKIAEPTSEQNAAWDARVAQWQRASQVYDEAKLAYDALPLWKRIGCKPHKPVWNVLDPGHYAVELTHFFDRTVEETQPSREYQNEYGRWASFEIVEVRVDDYSPQWYANQRQAVEMAELERQQNDAQFQMNMWRANAGAAFWDANRPWASERRPGGMNNRW